MFTERQIDHSIVTRTLHWVYPVAMASWDTVLLSLRKTSILILKLFVRFHKFLSYQFSLYSIWGRKRPARASFLETENLNNNNNYNNNSNNNILNMLFNTLAFLAACYGCWAVETVQKGKFKLLFWVSEEGLVWIAWYLWVSYSKVFSICYWCWAVQTVQKGKI